MSFLRDYTLFASGNESPDIYHTWSAFSAMSTFLTRKVWIEMGYFTVYPNMYVMLVGNPGIKKTTAMKLARRLVLDVGGRTVAPASITKEAMTQFMAEEGSPCKMVYGDHVTGFQNYTHLSIFSNELVNLLNAGGNPVGMIDLLTDIWDSEKFEVRTKNKGCDFIEKPYINILGCMTPEVMQNLLYQRIISGGFARRCIFVYADRNGEPVPIPELSSEQEEAWGRCVARGERLLELEGQFVWSKDAKEFWNTWYRENFRITEECDSIVLQGFHRSKPEYLIKLAMLITTSEADELVLTRSALETAVVFLDQVQPGIKVVFEGTGRNELSPIAGAIERFIQASDDPVKIKRIYSTFYQDATTDEIDQILEHLCQVDKAEKGVLTIGDVDVKVVATPEAMKNFSRKLAESSSDPQ